MNSDSNLRIAMAQLNMFVGNLEANKKKILSAMEIAIKNNCDIIVFPEMAISGYPIQDLIFDADFYESQNKVLEEIAKVAPSITAIIGAFGIEQDPSHIPKYCNLAVITRDGKITNQFSKRLLPTYDVFDEKRYFWAGNDFTPIEIKGIKIGIAICEDMWEKEYTVNVAESLVNAGAEMIISINASPYVINKQATRERIIREKTTRFHIPVYYLNLIGGQDELVFDGRSFIYNSDGDLVFRARFCKEQFSIIDMNTRTKKITPIQSLDDNTIPVDWRFNEIINPLYDVNQEIVEALCMNLRDYFEKTGVFERIILGLSGGVDSAFTAYIAAQAIGPDKVTAILMPSKFSSTGSIDDSIQLCKTIGIQYHIIPIKEFHDVMERSFASTFTDPSRPQDADLASQNLQSRLRGIILMYYSNLYRALLISTGNKSELATGYCTLYGDTNGGKNIPGDLYKTQLYGVCRWINREKEIIPKAIIDKPPSAELKPDQKDEDNLPPYILLDEILRMRIDDGLSPREIIAKGKDPALVYRIESLYTNSEYKRAQVAQTIKINKKTFGMGRKIPVLKKIKY
jgi:NAD+ synthetase